MSPSQRAREWFKKHAVVRLGPGGEAVAYDVAWSEEVELSLAGEFAEAGMPSHEAWTHRTNYVKPKMSFP